MKALLMALIATLALSLTQATYAMDERRYDRGPNASESRETQRERRAERRERRQERRLERRQARSVPELDGGYALAALGLVAGLVLVFRERRQKA